eukprot:TRINITY_DN12930_c0_g1_i1.p1 TRINITY_DN12930_c0_g1~~TRINITY_DN12930_c0_g1_i1.p1  ORF type:complete len:508 (-),score=62.78 TRINITY_DN12930_c0_g1_i1:251-1774(-)
MEFSMESSSLALYIAVVLGTLLLLLRVFSTHQKLNLPPGPKPWPIIGNLNLIGPLPHHSMRDLSLKYGPIMQLRFGSCPVVVGSSVDMAREFLKTHDLNFLSRPKTLFNKHISRGYKNMLWSPYGPYWRQTRKVCHLTLLTEARMNDYENIRAEEIYATLNALYGSAGRPIVLKDHLLSHFVNILSRMVLGKKYEEGEELENFKEILDESFVLGAAFNVADYIPWLGFMDLQGYIKRIKKVSKKLDWVFDQALDERAVKREKRRNLPDKCMADALLQLVDDPNLEEKFSRGDIKVIMQDMIGGGVETATSLTEWGITEILKHPEIYEKASEELVRVIGRERWVEEKDIDRLPYIQAIVKEILRLHPSGPLLVPHVCRDDCTISGYDIRAGTLVVVNAWCIARDPTNWDAPLEFRPERFVGCTIDVKGQDFKLLPFGSGRRMCPAYNLGLKMVQVTLANLLHGFFWKLPEKMNPHELNMEEEFGLAVHKKVPLVAIAEPLLPSHIYSM